MPAGTDPGPRFGSLEVNGADLAYVEAGSGELLLLVHGSLGSLSDFEEQTIAFSEHYRVVAYSRRFHPPNAVDGVGTEYAADRHAKDMELVLQALGEKAAHIVGVSYGGYVALLFALLRPGMVRSLVLAEPPILPFLRLSPLGRRLLADFGRDALEPSLAAFRRKDPTEGVRRFVDGIIGRSGSFDAIPSDARSRLLEAAPELKLEFTTRTERYMPEMAPDRLTAMRVPTLLLGAERSPLFFSIILNELERTLPLNDRILIPRSGHTMHSGNTPFFNRSVLDFLNGHSTQHSQG
jgi:pimeloyl-ACP methyl ester carboxylesterase